MQDNHSNDVTAAEKEKQTVLQLTTREKECLAKALDGKNLQQIAQEINVDLKTVYYYLNGVRVKLTGFVG